MRGAVWKSVAGLGDSSLQRTQFALLHSTPFSSSKWKSKSSSMDGGGGQESSKTYLRYSVRQKRSDAKSALKNLLLNGKSSKQYIQDDFDKHHQPKRTGKSKFHRSSLRKSQCNASKRWQNKNSFNQEYCDDPGTPSTFGGQRSFTWNWSAENLHFQSSSTGFEWRENSQWTKSGEKFWNESDVEEESSDIDLQSHRVTLGLPASGPLKLDDLKRAFRSSALKWHPDKHQSSSQAALAEERFKLCVDAYNSLSSALKPS
ncbi:uncharacterized protein [Typha angustifolia]|uniref:uncharacterized protein isoform X1 n=1 Tax=Typha angustifolia TaxID=59011 RepID=UPI003C2AF7C9